ncbi:hypothetical protein Acsp04_38710 [Actinomadura sp. NBRC 104425]|nr:hypothetical protein Acsp04_38710 [Actinomadura sp. NBRC 104425]
MASPTNPRGEPIGPGGKPIGPGWSAAADAGPAPVASLNGRFAAALHPACDTLPLTTLRNRF